MNHPRRPEPPLHPELRTFIDRAVVPALLERFLREHASAEQREPSLTAKTPLPKPEAAV